MKSKLSTSILFVVIASLILSGGMMLAGVMIGGRVSRGISQMHISGGDGGPGGPGGSVTVGTTPDYMTEYEAQKYLGLWSDTMEKLLERGTLEGTYVTFERNERVESSYDIDGKLVEKTESEEYRIFFKNKLDEFMQKRFAEQQASNSNPADTTND